MNSKKINRRSFVHILATFTGLSIFGFSAFAQTKRQPKKEATSAGEPQCKPGEGVAASINYQTKHSDVKDAKLKIEKQGVPFEKQNCANCLFYEKSGMNGKEEVGHCKLIPGCTVVAAGWSSSWAKKV